MSSAAYPAISLRHLRSVRCIADCGSVSQAATQLNRTQSAISKSLGVLECQLGVSLFDRSARGMVPTPQGALFIQRIREAEVQFAQAAVKHSAALRHVPRLRNNPVFTMETSGKRFEAFLAVHEAREVNRAAARLGITRAAVYGTVRHLEQLLELRLFESTVAGMRSTPFADVLAGHVMLAFSLLRHGRDEITSLNGATQGQVIIGTLPYARTVLIPKAIHRALQLHPQLKVATREGPYEVLEQSLRNGAIDLIIGATRKLGENSGLQTEDLFEDELAVICGAHHPLAHSKQISIDELLAFAWILPLPETPARQLFDRFLAQHGASLPRQLIETGSLSTIRGLLLVSDRLALLSTHQVHLDEMAGLLTTLPIRLEQTFRPIGITTRAHTSPSPAARVFIQSLKDTVGEGIKPIS